MSGIFISYRREDSAGHVGRLHDRLITRFGREQVFKDIDSIKPGEDFTQAIKEAMASCDVLIAVIGKRWLTETDSKGIRRLDNPKDFVRQEIAAALAGKTRVIPVLVQGTTMPNEEDLTEDLRSLGHRNAIEISDGRWDHDVDRLMQAIWKKPAVGRKALVAACIGLAVIAFVSYLLFVRSNVLNPAHLSPPSPPPIPSTPKNEAGGDSGQYPIHLRANQEVRLKTSLNDCTYKILTAEVERANSSTLRLRLVIRLTVNNSASSGAEFTNGNFRLLVDGVPRAPVSDLIQLVERHSAKEGTVEFTVPDTATKLILEVRDTGEVAEVPIDLSETAPERIPVAQTQEQSRFQNAQFPIRLRANQEVRLKTSLNDCTYKILTAEVERANSSTLRLRLVIRLTVNNSASSGAEFTNGNFRLLVDGVPRAPVSDLIQLVERHSAKEGTIEFALPDTATKLVLQVRDTGEVAEIPIDLSPL
jgi:hypothetical protein